MPADFETVKPGGTKKVGTSSNKLIWPTQVKTVTSKFGPRDGRLHAGIDIGVSYQPVFAALDGTVKHKENPGGYGTYIDVVHANGLVARYAHLSQRTVRDGERVSQGQKIGVSGNTGSSTGPHLHFEVRKGETFGADGALDPIKYLDGAALPDASGEEAPEGGGSTAGDGVINPTASAFATFLALPGLADVQESLALTGERSLMNDKPLFPFIQQLTEASLRRFMSMPNGNFYAFYPDYFGTMQQRTPYWAIDDIEVIDGRINLSDDALATHVYVVGDIVPFDGLNLTDKMLSGGVVTIFNAFMADFINPPSASKGKVDKSDDKSGKDTKDVDLNEYPTLANKARAINFLQKYGARPFYKDAPMVRSPYYEFFLAYQQFCLMWSKQFLTSFEFTYMPELYPGGIVAFPEHGIQCFIEEVEHICDYESGFVTRASLSAPASLKGAKNAKKNVHAGMIRAFDVEFPREAADVKANKKKPTKDNN